ncbi:hypothetical protein [Bradyrhizobium sp. CCBAU 45389]|uniref:hypothetical protein n=1 Tax=Bradyrhizobium sp. CCBAU 45389 TaxID=858429 RepID=UPI002305CFEC|nr:hypothetical protein [Bradyrhizobium sp. CCBAU 45389]MDA9398568.1 hypothetical protein [Bradyrhizobium sp. CCBAU 45389]
MDALASKPTVETWPVALIWPYERNSAALRPADRGVANRLRDEMLRLELSALVEGGFENALTGITG